MEELDRGIDENRPDQEAKPLERLFLFKTLRTRATAPSPCPIENASIAHDSRRDLNKKGFVGGLVIDQTKDGVHHFLNILTNHGNVRQH